MLFFPSTTEAYIQYDLSTPRSGRTFAKLLGSGLTTTNLTDTLENPCTKDIDTNEIDSERKGGTWHQATNSLRLILCERADKACKASKENTAFMALIHKKHPNVFKLPMRYERYFIVWRASPPFSMIGISKHPVLLYNETASGYTQSQNWDDIPANRKVVEANKAKGMNATEPFGGRGYWAYFTYTVSIAYAWGRENDEVEQKNVGYLDDEIVLSIGIDDKAQGFARVKARDLVQCLKACPGKREV